MMDEYLHYLKQKCPNGVIFDTNLLLLFVCGIFDIKLIDKFTKRLSKYSFEDFELLNGYYEFFKPLISTPHILAETSNLCDNIPLNDKRLFFKVFSDIIDEIDEQFIPASIVSKDVDFHHIGLTDTGVKLLSQKSYLILSEDVQLLSILTNKGYYTLDFNIIRKN
jgi:hypothetical protein